MLGEQRGGSAADKSRDRRRKLDGFEKWHFRLAIESLPVMLQFTLMLLGCALAKYLWTTSHIVAGVVAAFTLFGITSYVFLSLAAAFCNNCPYQTPPSILARALIEYLARGDDAFTSSLGSLLTSFPSIENVRQILRRLRAGVRRVRESSGLPGETGDIPLAIVNPPPSTRIFGDVSVDWEVCKGEARCISWVLSTTTDTDVIYSTVRFAADTIWYPEIVEKSSPHILADLFLDCLMDGRAVPGKCEHAISIGMALASLLSTQLTVEPETRALRELCDRIGDCVKHSPLSEPAFRLVVNALKFVADSANVHRLGFWDLPNNLSTTQKLWLSRIALQTSWRWGCVHKSTDLDRTPIELICNGFALDNDQTPTIVKTNWFLTMAIWLGLKIDVRDLYAPNNKCVVSLSFLSHLLIDR